MQECHLYRLARKTRGRDAEIDRRNSIQMTEENRIDIEIARVSRIYIIIKIN